MSSSTRASSTGLPRLRAAAPERRDRDRRSTSWGTSVIGGNFGCRAAEAAGTHGANRQGPSADASGRESGSARSGETAGRRPERDAARSCVRVLRGGAVVLLLARLGAPTSGRPTNRATATSPKTVRSMAPRRRRPGAAAPERRALHAEATALLLARCRLRARPQDALRKSPRGCRRRSPASRCVASHDAASARALLGGATATLGAALLLTIFSFAHHARRAQLDVLLALFETLALAAFWRVDRRHRRGAARRPAACCTRRSALAVLTKGPVGFLSRCSVIAGFLAWERRLRDLRRAFPWWGLFALAAARRSRGSRRRSRSRRRASSATRSSTISSAASSRAPRTRGPFYYYLYQFPLDFLPWFLLAPAVWWAGATPHLRRRRGSDEERRAWRFLLAWIGATLVFFSLSTGKRGLYLLPLLPGGRAADRRRTRALGRGGAPHPGRLPRRHGHRRRCTRRRRRLRRAARSAARRDGLARRRLRGARRSSRRAAIAQLTLWRARARLRLRLAIPVIAVVGAAPGDLHRGVSRLRSREVAACDRRGGSGAHARWRPDRPRRRRRRWPADSSTTAIVASRRCASAEDIRRFLAAGGHAIVVEEKKRDARATRSHASRCDSAPAAAAGPCWSWHLASRSR